MRPAKRGQKVVQSVFVGQIHDCQARAPFVLVAEARLELLIGSYA